MYSFTLSQLLMLYSCIGNAKEFTDGSFMLLTMMGICGKIVNIIVKRKVIRDILRSLLIKPFKPENNEEQAIISNVTNTIK